MSESDGLSSSSSSSPFTSSDSMSNTSSSVQLGGKGYHHKKGCKCVLCKKRGRKNKKGGDDTPDIEMGLGLGQVNLEQPDIETPRTPEMLEEDSVKDLEMGPINEEEDSFKDVEVGTIPEYNPDAAEMAGGKTRKRGRKGGRKTRKVSKRKTRKAGKRKSRKGKKHSSRRK
jgi:hypothetical protein